MIINSSSLVSQTVTYGGLSANQAGFTNSNIIDLANLVMVELIAELIRVGEEYLIYRDRIAVTAGNDTLRIPYRSIGGKIRHLWFEDAAGNRTRLNAKYEENLEDYQASAMGSPSGFYMMGNSVTLLPSPNANGTLVVAYPFRPNLLVDTSTTQSVSSMGASSVTLPNMPLNFTNGAAFDIIDHRSGNGPVYYDLTGTISGNTITFGQTIPNVVVGNYVALANQSPVPMIPEDLHPLLLELVVLRIAEARGDQQRIGSSNEKVKAARAASVVLTADRVVSKPHPVGGSNPLLPQRSMR